ncbi:MAG: hypothetical protein MJZ87_07265 [Bacteroidales bacterium]|nr:hypothetical protein [Bacteroidales bacterium]
MLFKDVLVDPQLKQQILNQVHEHRISHAQFFLAQSGSHAFALAIALAQYLCCEHPSDEDSCGECPSCKQFEKLAHPDLHLYFPNCLTKSVKKDNESLMFAQEFRDFVFKHNYFIEIQDWLAELDGENKQATINIRDCSHIVNQNSIRSYAGGYKIYILWNVDRLYHAAAPKLLKTLEEPENKSLFILISEKPDLILSTILSRTQLVKIPRLSNDLIAAQLKHDFPDIDDKTAMDIAILSEGDYNKAVKVHADDSDQKSMLNTFSLMLNSIVSFAQQQPPAVVKYAEVQEEFAHIVDQGRETQKQFVGFVLKMLRNILMLNTKHENIVKATEAEMNVLRTFKGVINLKHVSIMTEECNKALYHIGRNGNSALIFTDLYFKMAAALK